MAAEAELLPAPPPSPDRIPPRVLGRLIGGPPEPDVGAGVVLEPVEVELDGVDDPLEPEPPLPVGAGVLVVFVEPLVPAVDLRLASLALALSGNGLEGPPVVATPGLPPPGSGIVALGSDGSLVVTPG